VKVSAYNRMRQRSDPKGAEVAVPEPAAAQRDRARAAD
jgi:hypothetical protein